jgi:hypothetical protein
LAIAGLAVVIVYAGLIGYIRADNFRFLLTTSVFGIGAGVGVLATWHAGGAQRTPAIAAPDQNGFAT